MDGILFLEECIKNSNKLSLFPFVFFSSSSSQSFIIRCICLLTIDNAPPLPLPAELFEFTLAIALDTVNRDVVDAVSS